MKSPTRPHIVRESQGGMNQISRAVFAQAAVNVRPEWETT